MAFKFTKYLDRLGKTRGNALSTARQTNAPSGAKHGQPQIEPGSTLDTMVALNASAALTYLDVVANEIKQAIGANKIVDPETTTTQVLEQIHSLKNAIAPTGSRKLLKDCEQLRLDAIRCIPRAELAQGYKAVGSAAILLLRNYRRILSRDAADSNSSSECNRHDPQA